MQTAYDQLPEAYGQIAEIDLKKNKKLFWMMNIGSFVLLIPFVPPLFFFTYTFELRSSVPVLLVLILCAALVLMTVVHELIHGLFFKAFAKGKGKLKFGFHGFAASCGMPMLYFNKPAYLVSCLAPLILMSAVFGILCGVFYQTHAFIILYAVLAINFGGCIGDIYVALRLIKMPATVLCNDYGIGMLFYDRATNDAS